MITGIFIFLLFILPFVVIPSGISPFETYKVIVAEILIEILLFIKFVHPKSFRFSRFNRAQVVLVFLLFSLIIIDLMIFQSSANLFGNPFRLQGILLLFHLLAFSLLSSLLELKIPKFVYITSLLLLFVTTIFFGINNSSRFFGSLGEPNALAATAVFIFPFIYFYEKLPFKITGLLLTLIIVFLSGSRSGLVALLIQISFILLSQKVNSLSKTFLICLSLLGLSLLLPLFENNQLYENRFMVWQTALSAGLESPFVGSGFGNIESAIHSASLSLDNTIRFQFVDSSHNFILDFFIQGGILGLLIIGTMLFLSVRNLILHSKKMEIAILLGLLTAMSFNPASVVTLIGFWFVIGQGFLKAGGK
ncbi:MAG: O-antigen ligase family protein [Patescibacteria group bacterium]